ncbi:efflux RND transporter periplasmic adaptor subunit [Frigoriflavimonas asaccharolytica]|uniref:Membrane fusion protein (Multidrug efflux system) n=1 Tax=Frigoriflavimonas asaccharolytica TaxID=2735899 RepID=A0A8J8G8M9_9FLAO|nr:efflux RND transporter periplasmic adaptor subunit [Frigoriflavimonas asaccharolytica]NRS91514.1 membrane fusion protein (multidrug efflux system) [Frigoriflavimonas asaccharolytica]
MKKFASLFAFVLLLSLTNCTNKAEEKETAEVFPVTTALQKDTIVTKEYVSQIRSVKNIEIRAQEKGFLQNVYVDEGQYVKAGQPLFRIMPQLYQAEYQKAMAEVEEAKIELQNASTLANNNVVSKNEQRMAKAKLDGAKAEANLANLHLSFTNVRAPFSGIINRLPMKLGSLVDEGDLLTSLSDNGDIYAYFNVSEPEYISYQTKMADRGDVHVNLLMANGEQFPQAGIIQTIEGEFDAETGNIAFRAKFPNPNALLRNGETGKILMNFPLNNALIIPQKATYEIQDQKYVFVVDKTGKVVSRNIKIAYELPDVYVVSSGLSAKDKFVVDGVQKLKENQKVKVKYQQAQQVISSLKLQAD